MLTTIRTQPSCYNNKEMNKNVEMYCLDLLSASLEVKAQVVVNDPSSTVALASDQSANNPILGLCGHYMETLCWNDLCEPWNEHCVRL